MANKIKPARGVKNRIETVKETLEPYELIISTDTEQLGYKKSGNEVAYMANEKKLNDEVNNLLSYINQSVSTLESSKQDELVSGVNIKTLGMQRLLGSGNISIPSTDEFATKAELNGKLDKIDLEIRQVGETTIQRNVDGLVIKVTNPTVVSTPLYVDGKLVSLNETYSDGKSYVTTFNRLPDGTLVTINKQEVL